MNLDVIGDIHGELPALHALGKFLGYDVDNDWQHPEGRTLVFLGDLVDRGAHSLEVAELVQHLVETGRAACIMGNHEYNLVAWNLQLPGYLHPKLSNKATTEHIESNRARWNPVLEFLRDLPIALTLPDLRIIHACWHVPSYQEVREILQPSGTRSGILAEYIELDSPFTSTALKAGLKPWISKAAGDSPHELLLKGYEVPALPRFRDNDGKERDMKRETWWLGDHDQVLTDRAQVVGHYWHLPPIDGLFCPPHPSGHPALRDWAKKLVARVPDSGSLPAEGEMFCVDFNGVTQACERGRACVGALRWPERRIAWATAPRTRTALGHD